MGLAGLSPCRQKPTYDGPSRSRRWGPFRRNGTPTPVRATRPRRPAHTSPAAPTPRCPAAPSRPAPPATWSAPRCANGPPNRRRPARACSPTGSPRTRYSSSANSSPTPSSTQAPTSASSAVWNPPGTSSSRSPTSTPPAPPATAAPAAPPRPHRRTTPPSTGADCASSPPSPSPGASPTGAAPRPSGPGCPYDDTHTVPDTPAGALDVPLDTALDVAGGLAPEAGCGGRDREWLGRGALSFLAEASDLLAGQLDEDLVAALTGQLIVPRLADWCAVWLEDEISARGRWGAGSGGPAPRPARVWHTDEHLVEDLRRALDKEPPEPPDVLSPGPVPYPWPTAASGSPVPGDARDPEGTRREAAEAGIGGTGAGGHGSGAAGAPGDPGVSDVSDVLGVTAAAEAASGGAAPHGAALAYRLVAGGRPLGTLVIGRAGVARFPDEVTGLVEDLSRRVALAIGAARQYARQATISAVLQRGLLPGALPEIPGMSSALVHEPCDIGGPSGDFYDLFPAGEGRWCFAVGDVQGKGPEAAVVIGLARPWLRLLAREGYGVADVLDRLNQLLLDDATEAADAAARALVGPTAPGDGPQNRFLSLLYGELVPHGGGVRCTLASAGHPLPLVLGPDGTVRTAARPQTLLGVVEDETYTSETVELRPGDTLLCVTDGVTERRSGSRQFDDGDGLAGALAGCVGLGAEEIATRIRRLVHEFGGQPPEDDLALLVLQAG
ncbi:PP2C family protein-serine/threonine phosphatase [Streptomyces thermocoprophilus]|uniref:PP2C family protein-serine/threonine phosphatase n=1 Tax=Streptomyces thermocoprophilus TaxID=78356 RepID=UPI00360EE032